MGLELCSGRQLTNMYSFETPTTSSSAPLSTASSYIAQTLSDNPSLFRYVLGFLLIGLAWGFTTPFIRAAARDHKPPPHPILDDPAVKNSWIRNKVYGAFFGFLDLLRNPRYAVPLVINLTGSIWFFLLIGQAGEC